ncbi:MAG: hypothetical protein HY646_20265 [Acidobacteria bacterium]|nr:hypothetical protein [Acidobacteriota bacterium]
MNRYSRSVLAVAVFLLPAVPAFSMPEFLQMYRSDPFRNPAVDGCNTCHMSPDGGDARNAFGQAFESGGEVITTMLRAQFPDRFIYPVSKTGSLTIHFSDPNNKQVVVETGGAKNLVDVEKRTVDGQAAATPGAPAVTSAAPVAAAVSEVRVDEYAREGAFFGSNVVNLPNGKPARAGGVDFFIGHRFGQDIKASGFGGLFGFDSFATVAFAGRVGLTDRLSVAVMRSNFFRSAADRTPIEFSSAFQVSRQKDSVPVTVQVRGGVEGSRNFHDLYRPFLQAVVTRTFADRVSVTLAPTFAFNTRNDDTFVAPDQLFGFEHNHTQSLGVGVGIRFLPSASIVGEYIPRLHGFRGERQDYGGLSVGLQKSTFRHTFELVVTRQQPMTTAQYAFQGIDTFRIGFNIYRRIR